MLFKPTKAAQRQFRSTVDVAMSYFIGGNSEYPDDKGFALQPWTSVRFENAKPILKDDYALVMGNNVTDTESGETKVEYTFGYIKDGNGRLRKNVHQ